MPALETLSSLGFEERNPGCPGNFAGMSRTPGGVQKVCAKKLRAHFSFPIHGRKRAISHRMRARVSIGERLRGNRNRGNRLVRGGKSTKIKKSTQNKKVHLNNSHRAPNSCHREEGKSSCELFEKVRVNAPFFFQRRRNDNSNKICVLEWVGEGEIYGKLSQNAVFPGKFHDNQIWKFCEFYCQKLCCHLGGSYCWYFGILGFCAYSLRGSERF